MKLDLCCHKRKPKGFIGLDIEKYDDVDVVADLNDGIPLEDNSCDVVRAYDALEHIKHENRDKIMREIFRVLKPGGILDSKTPSTDGWGAFMDPFHFAFYNEGFFWYYTQPHFISLYDSPQFEVIELYTTEKTSNVCWVVAKLRKPA